MKNLISFTFALGFVLVFSACNKEYKEVIDGNYTIEDYEKISEVVDIPNELENYSDAVTTINNREAVLGRVLFYDKKITKHENLSCASCHKQELAFSDDVALSEGVDGELTSRNSIALGQFDRLDHYYGRPVFGGASVFWDGRALDLTEQLNETMRNPTEMDIDFDNLVSKLEDQEHYKILFSLAYSDGEITNARITTALESFMRTFKSNKAKFDSAQGTTGAFNDFAGFTASENRGKRFFADHCQSCHMTLTSPTTSNMSNNGLDFEYTDKGKAEWEQGFQNVGVFKAPSLRNIALTGPYMHDGRFETLRDVVDFYNDEVKNHPNLHDDLKNNQGNPKKLNMTEQDKVDLENFMLTLSDTELTTAEKWSNPFKS